jgi:hypothetical protein
MSSTDPIDYTLCSKWYVECWCYRWARWHYSPAYWAQIINTLEEYLTRPNVPVPWQIKFHMIIASGEPQRENAKYHQWQAETLWRTRTFQTTYDFESKLKRIRRRIGKPTGPNGPRYMLAVNTVNTVVGPVRRIWDKAARKGEMVIAKLKRKVNVAKRKSKQVCRKAFRIRKESEAPPAGHAEAEMHAETNVSPGMMLKDGAEDLETSIRKTLEAPPADHTGAETQLDTSISQGMMLNDGADDEEDVESPIRGEPASAPADHTGTETQLTPSLLFSGVVLDKDAGNESDEGPPAKMRRLS